MVFMSEKHPRGRRRVYPESHEATGTSDHHPTAIFARGGNQHPTGFAHILEEARGNLQAESPRFSALRTSDSMARLTFAVSSHWGSSRSRTNWTTRSQ